MFATPSRITLMIMINLNLYDNVLERNINWIDPKYKAFYSRTMIPRSFYTILKRYDNCNKVTNFYIVLSEELTEDRKWFGVNNTGRGYIKIDLSKFWDKLKLDITDVTEVSIKIEEESDNATIYYIDI